MKIACTCLSMALICSISSCVPKARTNQLVPKIKSSTQTGQAVTVRTSGGNEQVEVVGLGVSSDDFRQALEDSMVSSGLFQRIGDGGYQLEARIVYLKYPVAGFTVTTEMEVAYTLRRAGKTVWEESIRASHLTETNEAMLSEFRLRKSTEGAVRESIRLAISWISEELG